MHPMRASVAAGQLGLGPAARAITARSKHSAAVSTRAGARKANAA